MVPVVASLVVGTFTGVRYVVNLTDSINQSEQEIVNLQRDLTVAEEKIAEINDEKWEGYTADGSVGKGNDTHIAILDNWFKNASPRWEVRWMIANSVKNEDGEIEQWLTTGNDYYDVDADGNEVFEYNVHDVQFKDGKIIRVNVYSRAKEQGLIEYNYQLKKLDSKEFSY